MANRSAATAETWIPKDEVDDLARVVDVVGGDSPDIDSGVTWNRRKTQFTLAHPLIRDHVGIPAGKTVTFDASYHDGQWRGPDAATVVLMFQSGLFAGTGAAKERARRAAAVEYERGVGRDPQGPDGPGPEGLETLTSEQQLALLEDMLRGGPAEVKRKERQEARQASEEIVAAMGKVIGEDRKELVSDLAAALRANAAPEVAPEPVAPEAPPAKA